jgi:hypothetical protein
MAETQRKQAESQARMQLDAEKSKQDYQLRIAELQRQVAELETKYQTQSAIDSNKSTTQIALADVNNASRERVAAINAQAGLTADQMAMAHEQNQTAFQASNAAQQELTRHGLDIEKRAFEQQAAQTQELLKAAATQQPPTNPTGV